MQCLVFKNHSRPMCCCARRCCIESGHRGTYQHIALYCYPRRMHYGQSKYTCVSENVVYAIKCRTCHKVNISETGGRLGNRFRENLRSTRLTDTDLPVGRHFASPGHTAKDILVSVIRSGFSSTTHRRSFSSFKARMIFKHQTLHPGGLNTDFNFL